MSKTNSQIVQEYFEIVINQKHFERTFEFCSQDCIILNPPYIGLGFNSDDSSGEQIIITEIAQNAPATGKLQVKDQIVRVKDAEKTWETFQDLKAGSWGWGQGILGTQVTITVNRGGKQIEIPLTRGHVEGFNLKLSTNVELWSNNTLKYWPDIQCEIKLICAEGDLVAYYAVDSGINHEFMRSAVWDECGIYRFKEGKIIEMWGIENTLGLLKQLGYQVHPPVA